MERRRALGNSVRQVLALLTVAAAVAEAAAQIIVIPSRGDSEPTVRSRVKLKEAEPAKDGPAKLICASPYGDRGNDQIRAVRILPDRSILLAGNLNTESAYSGGGDGFLVRLTVQNDRQVSAGSRAILPGTLNEVKADAKGNLYVLLDNAAVYHILPGASEPTKHCVREGIKDFGVDGNGELVILHEHEITRYDATWQKEKWTAKWHSYGTDCPRGLDVCPSCGMTSVIGYATAHTGRGRWNGPFAHGFDRQGKHRWALWDQDPKKQLSKKDGGNGLTADTVGDVARAGAPGKLYLTLYAENEKTIGTRDPNDSDKPLDKDVFRGVYQDKPGRGFRGSADRRTSVAFRVDAATGTLERGTWMCAWVKEGKTANPLSVYDLDTDEEGRTFVVGHSAFGCPTKDPWYFAEGDYQGDGFLSVFDKDFQILQSGYFHQTSVYAVDAAHGYVVIGGCVKTGRDNPELPLRVHRPIQKSLAGGWTDGFVAVFVTGDHGVAQALPAPGVAPAPAPQVEAARLLREARAAIAAHKTANAKTNLQMLVARFPRSPQAAEAKGLLERMAAKPPKPAPKPAAGADEEKADRLLQVAENYLANNLKSMAKAKLRELLRKYPKTEAAKRGQKVWDEHFFDQ